MEIKVVDLFDEELTKCYQFALTEFGRKTAIRWDTEYKRIRHRLKLMPESYTFVPELKKWRKYRGAIIMKNFKIIYFYNEKLDVVWLVDLWDLRQDPRKLRVRARKIEKMVYL